MMEILLEVQHLTIAYPQNREVVRELNLCQKKEKDWESWENPGRERR